MKTYVGTKILKAEPLNLGGYNELRGWTILENEDPKREGYCVTYSDGYISWSPKEVFEKSYLLVDSENNTISRSMINDFIDTVISKKFGAKTTVTQVTLKNGFIITESFACVNPANYAEAVGELLNMERIRSKIWELLGFMLQTGINGVNGPEKAIEC